MIRFICPICECLYGGLSGIGDQDYSHVRCSKHSVKIPEPKNQDVQENKPLTIEDIRKTMDLVNSNYELILKAKDIWYSYWKQSYLEQKDKL